jgi:hypothetical protein
MTLCEHVHKILEEHDIDPTAEVEDDNGIRLAQDVLEAAILGALDEIEDNIVEGRLD